MSKDAIVSPLVTVPVGYPTATIFVDESGSRASGSRFFVMGAVKTRRPGHLARAMQDVRDRTGFRHEFRFSEITQGNLVAYYEALDALAASDAHIAASVVNKDVYDPFPKATVWTANANVTARLLVGCINLRELVTVVLDEISTPVDVAYDELVKRQVNSRFKSTSVISAICADSKSMDNLQLADLVAGAIAFERRRSAGESGKVNGHPNSPKAKVAARLFANFSLTSVSSDVRNDRVNIATLRGSRSQSASVRPLRVGSARH